MPVYNNPALGKGFESLAAAFAPPSGSDLAGYATASAKKEEAARLAQLYTMAQSPDFNQSTFDRSNIAVGNYNPTQSFYAQDQNNGTAMRGQDIAASTSITNNTADNDQAMMQAILGAATDPVAQDAMRPGFNPADFGVAGVPAVPQFAGSVSPMSETEVLGAERQALRENGTLTDQMLLDAIVGKETPVQVMTPNGPQYSTPGAAVRSGATPYDKPSGATETNNYKTPDGSVGSARFDTTVNDWLDTSTGERIPAGSVTYSAGLTGDAASTGLGPKPTEMTDRAGMFYNRASPASVSLDGAITEGYVPSDADYEGMLGAMSGLPNAVNRHIISPEGRKFYGNATNFMMAVLRPDTGAAFGPEEFQNYARVFVPLPGDTPDIIAQKSQARQIALTALRGTSRGAAEQIAALLAEQGLPVPPEMEAVIARGGAKAGAPAAAAPPAPAPRDVPPDTAIGYLRANPDAAADFDAKYGDGAAASALGGGV